MLPVLTAQQMSALDQKAINEFGIPGVVLMENAGRGIAEIAISMLEEIDGDTIHIYCGSGNNGGDGYVVARHLINSGYDVLTFMLAPKEKIKGDALVNLNILEKMGFPPFFIESIPQNIEEPDLIVDALLGTGVNGPLKNFYTEIVDFINEHDCPVLAVDIPTGVNADNGTTSGTAIEASTTATMAHLKRGLLFNEGQELAGEIDIVDISMPLDVLDENHNVWEIDSEDVEPLLPIREASAFKNKCGTVSVLAGSKGFTGAATLTSEACLRIGSGLTYLFCPESLNAVFESKSTEVITCPVKDDAGFLQQKYIDEPDYEKMCEKDILAVGPGLGQHDDTKKLVLEILEFAENPLVLDADGLNVLGTETNPLKKYKGDLVITPHPGELSRLTGLSTREIIFDPITNASKVATELGITVVLKGGPTVIALSDGMVYINSTGNPGMATAGSGDVLTGVIAGLLAQGLSVEQAALVGVFVHGLAGDLALEEKGEHGLIASDILNHLPDAMKKISESE